MKKIIFYVLLSVFVFSLSAQESDDLEFLLDAQLFHDNGNNPLILTDGNDWVQLGRADLSEPKTLAGFKLEDYQYRMRFKVALDDLLSADQCTLQLRFQMNDKVSLYHIPLDNASRSDNQLYSSWYIPSNEFKSQTWDGLASMRILSPPGREALLHIENVDMELWGNRLNEGEKEEEEKPNRQVILASSGNFYEWTNSRERPVARNEEKSISRMEALSFAVHAVEIILQGDIPAFYSILSNEVYALNSGNKYSCYRIPPPQGSMQSYSIEEYKTDYNYKVYSYYEFIELFPHWAEANRNWQPDSNTYLFMGNSKRFPSKETPLDSDELLVFMIGCVDNEMKIIARPEI